MIKRLFSKRSGFTLVEIIVAFAVFAIMAAMIVQILDLVSWQRRSNTEYANGLDEQEQYLVTHDKLGYNEANGKDGTLKLDFSDTVKLTVDYQMNGASPTGEGGGLSYFVSQEGKRDENSGGDDGGDDEDDDNNNTGAQTDRMDARITGTKGFDYVSVNKVIKVKDITDESGKIIQTVYAFELCANAGSGMNKDDIPYANYRLYFNDTNGNPCKIVSANYLNVNSFSTADDVNNLGSGAKTAIRSDTGAISNSPDNTNKYTVSLTGANGIRVGSPFKAAVSNNNGSSTKYICTQCGTIYANSWDGWSNCPKGTGGWDPCHNHFTAYVEAPAGDEDYKGNGVKFTKDNTTKIEITFAGTPTINVNSFGENGKQQPDGSYQYKANSTIAGGVSTGANIYGAYPKKK